MVLACVVAGSRAVLVARRAARLGRVHRSVVSWTFGEIWDCGCRAWSRTRRSPTSGSSASTRLLPRNGRLDPVPGRPNPRTLWLDGVTASLAAAAVGAAVLFELVLVYDRGSPATVATNLAYPLGDVLLLSAVVGVFSLNALAAGAALAVLGAGILCDVRRRLHLPLPERRGTYVEGTGSTSSGRLPAADRGRRLGRRPAPRGIETEASRSSPFPRSARSSRPRSSSTTTSRA